MTGYYCYILECSDGTLYTGWTTDPARRLREHNAGRGAQYTRCRTPNELVYVEEFASRRRAMQREIQIKRRGRPHKLKLIDSQDQKELSQWKEDLND
ncbi:MAG: GIY-YIG nuclease family protein [Anaerolineales bacterium]